MPLSDSRLFHVNVNCADLERSRAFYAAGLGLEIGAHAAPETVQPGAAFGLERARWDASILLGPHGYDGGAIDLLQWHEPAPVGAAAEQLVETGFQRLGLPRPRPRRRPGRRRRTRRAGVERAAHARVRTAARSGS